jgi:hypothetical protein
MPSAPLHLLPTICSNVQLVERIVFPLPAGVRQEALLLDDVDGGQAKFQMETFG